MPRLTRQEIVQRMGYILLGFFSVYLVEPLRTFVDANLQINPWIIGIGGILLVLFFFDV